MLEAKGLATVGDLLSYVPFRYEDRSNVKTVAQLAPGEMATVIADVLSAKASGFKRRDLGMFEARFSDASRGILVCKWFHGGYLANVLAPGMRVALYGKVEFDSYNRELAILHPEFEILTADDDEGEAALHVGRVVPIYEAAGKVTTRALRTLVWRVLSTLAPLPDEMPAQVRDRLRLPGRWAAIRETHFPGAEADIRLLNAFRSPAQIRLIFEEFFWLECGIALKRSQAQALPGIAFELNDRVRERIKAMLPFKPTAAQKRVLGEIARDMAAPHPMNRLLQGDVGSGKTIVAAEAAVIAIENGFQVAVLAPTEILAAQHAIYLKQILGRLGYVLVLLTGSFTSREKAKLKALLAEGLAHLAVGTHALIEKDVEFKNLGLAIIDEQHRFG
jgi:ATP-dependent DNA helicase RecG